MKLNLDRETLLQKSRENRGKLIEKEIANIKETIEEAVSRGLEDIIYNLDNRHSHIKEDLIDIITESGLTAKAIRTMSYHSEDPKQEISITWKDESGIELF